MDSECRVLVGGGCAGRRSEGTCTEDSADSGTSSDPEPGGAWVGGGGACATSPGGFGALLLLLLVFAARAAFAVDVQHLTVGDGGPIPGVVDPGREAPWTPRFVLGVSQMANPVRLRVGEEVTSLVTDVSTLELSASLQIADWFRAGLTVPTHSVGLDRGDSTVGVGDLGAFVLIPVGDHVAISTGLEAAPGRSPDFVHQGSATFGVSGLGDLAFLTLGGHARARFQQPKDLPGVRWGHRLELAGGARTRGWAGLGVTALVGAPLGLVLAPAAGAWPVEGLGFGALRLAPGVDLEAGGGAGLTWGLGSPSWRAFAVLRLEGHRSDLDGDGIGDLTDLCRERPEDRDRFRDRDGCPEDDNDGDGFVDSLDACPDDAEVVNGFEDDEGCPDELARWRVVVLPEGEPEQLRIGVDGVGDWQLETTLDLVVLPGRHHLLVEAPGHRTFETALEVPPGRSEVEVRLEVVRLGDLRVSLVDPEGRPLAGSVALGDEGFEVPAGGTTATVESGARYGTASAPGHLPETLRALVPPGGTATLEVVLEPEPARVDKPPVLFGLDSTELAPAAVELLDTLARWLRDHPGVRLLRIEGHADALGSPAYNYTLSVGRAAAVRDALVARGIAADRLDPVGSGEARAHLVPEDLPPSFSAEVSGVPARDVTFRVLVWDEALALDGP